MPSAQLYLVMLGFIRAGGLLALLPFFSARNIPMPVRLALAAFLGWSGVQLSPVQVVPPTELATLFLAILHEILVGLLMGMAVRFIFFALETAGQIMATEMGLMMSSQLDPVSQNNSTSVGTSLSLFGTLVFLISGAHHAVFAAFVRSFLLVAPGTTAFQRGAGEVFVEASGNIFLIALQMAAPLMAINFVVTLSFAILGKAAPGVNAFQESAPVRVLAGLTLFSLSLGLSAQLLLSHLRGVPELMLRLIP